MFKCPWCSYMFDCLALRFSNYNLTVSSFFTSKTLVNRHSDFWAHGCLTGVDVMGDIGLSSVNNSGVETISASRISLNCYWSSHLPDYLYSFWMFSRHLRSCIALLLKDWSISMVCKWYFSRGDWNITLRMKHCCSDVLIERTYSTTLVIIPYLINLSALAVLPRSENTHILYPMEVIS